MRVDLAWHEHELQGYKSVTLENSQLAITVLPGKGGEIHTILLKSRGLDLLWKAPWGLHPARFTIGVGAESEAAWMDNYAGGWQGIFPNGGDSCSYRGATLGFHGEASTIAWSYQVIEDEEWITLNMETRLVRCPFHLQRSILLLRDSANLVVQEIFTNESEQDLHCMWGHHPALSTEFAAGARIETSATSFEPAQPPVHHLSRIAENDEHCWPLANAKSGRIIDMSRLPAIEERTAEFGFLTGLRDGRYRIINDALGVLLECRWDIAVFPYVWLWIEWGAREDWPWYGRCRTVALEPFSSIPGSGLVHSIERGTAMLFRGGESRRSELHFKVEQDSR